MSDLTEKLKDHLSTKTPASTKPELVSRVSQPVLDVLNQQIKNELVSSQIYRAMTSWLDDKGWPNASILFFKYADEELTHMNKIYQYLYDRNCKAIVPDCPKVITEFANMRSILETSLSHEFEVTGNWENISNTALTNKDNTTHALSVWFLGEQREEESKFRDMLFQLNLGMPDWAFDQSLEEKL